MLKRPTLLVILVFLGLVFLAEYKDIARNGHPWGFPLDDAWIHMTFGRNWANGLGFGINPGEPCAASTSVPWSLWIGLLHWSLGTFGLRAVIFGVKMSGILLSMVAIVGFMRIFSLFMTNPLSQLVGGLLVLSAYPLSWAALSGMEVSLSVALCVWALSMQFEALTDPEKSSRNNVAIFLWAMAVPVRPENAVLFVVATFIAAGNRKRPFCQNLLRFGFFSLPIFLVHFGICYYLLGSPVPSTFAAKMTARAWPLLLQAGHWSPWMATLWQSPFKDLTDVFWFVTGESPGVLILLILTPFFFREARNAEPTSAFARALFPIKIFWLALPGLAILVGWIAGPEHYTLFHGRYLAHTLIISTISACLAADWVWQKAGRPIWIVLFLILSGLFFVDRQLDLAPQYALETQNINTLQVTLARWFGKKWTPNLTLGVNDIGAISYFGRQRIFDLEGLATPESLSYRRAGNIDTFLEKVQPDMLAIFPYWYPEIVKRKDLFHPALKHAIVKNVTGGGEELVLFIMPWTKNIPKFWPTFDLGELPQEVPVPPVTK